MDAKVFLTEEQWNGKLSSNGWIDAEATLDVIEPATGELLTSVGLASAEQVHASATKARTAQIGWAATSYKERAEVFRAAVVIVRENMSELASWIMRETGSARPKAEFELGIAISCLNEAAAMPSQSQGLLLPSEGSRISMARRQPLGVVGVISPFNFPLYLSLRAVAPALAIGNAVVLKPDPRTPITGGYMIARIFEAAGLPTDVLHVLPGEASAGEAICTSPDIAMVQFTGSTATGSKVGALAGQHFKKVSLELGGKNALIVLDDADLDLAASNAAFGAFLHQGQICMSSGRILVHRNIVDAFVEKLAAKASAVPVGNPTTEAVALGPMISASQVSRVHSIVEETVAAGAKLVAGGTHEGQYYRPTVLSDVKPGMRAFEEEIFGPVAAITSFSDDTEAVALANQTQYGLSAGVISKSVARAMKLGNQLRTGLLHINDQTVGDDVVNPFGGKGSSGNGTSIGGPANWDEFSQWQWITIRDEAPAYPF